MSNSCRATFEDRITSSLGEQGGRIPVILGLCGAGRTTILEHLQQKLGTAGCQYVNVERTATTPERFFTALTCRSPFANGRSANKALSNPKEAYQAVLTFLADARQPDGGPATFLLDEVLEFRTFESFPGLRRALPDMLTVLSSTPNRFVLTSRYVTRSQRAFASASPHFLLTPAEGLSRDEVAALMAERGADRPKDAAPPSGPAATELVASAVHRLAQGRPAYVRALVDVMSALDGANDPVAALGAAFEPGGRISTLCAFCYELRLHRARGYGALKAVLDILSQQEPLTLTEIARLLGRTPGSTKDYLSWLEDVDLVSVTKKRYRFRDPLLRVWVRLHCRPVPPSAEEVAREVQAYAAGRLTDEGA